MVARFRPQQGEEVPVAEVVGVSAPVLEPAVARGHLPAFVEPLVQRICAEYGAAASEVRDRIADMLLGFANARIQTFVPILVEKRLQQMYRPRSRH